MADALNDDPVYVAVSKDVCQSRLTLTWALNSLPVKKLYLLHVHQQISINPTSRGLLEQSEIDAIHESELTSIYEMLHKYRDICEDEGISKQDVDISCNLANTVGEGIVELIYENNIKKLIMGAAADSQYSEGVVKITCRKAEYVSRHAPHCCKIWIVSNGNLIQTRKGRFDLVGSSHSSSSESLTSLHGLDSALIPYEGAGRAEEDDTTSHSLLSPEDPSPRQRLKEQMIREREEELSSSFGVTKILYNEEVSRRREAEEELNRAKAEIENMKRVQKQLEEELYTECPRLLEIFQKERDEAIKTSEELLSLLNLDKGESSSPCQWSVPCDPPPYFFCPISKEMMRNPHVAADGYTYEAAEFRSWLNHGGEKSPMTNLRLENHNLIPNLVLRSAINDWLQEHPYFSDLP